MYVKGPASEIMRDRAGELTTLSHATAAGATVTGCEVQRPASQRVPARNILTCQE
jgi:hypothetical protein